MGVLKTKFKKEYTSTEIF